jgi:hypothetical protein
MSDMGMLQQQSDAAPGSVILISFRVAVEDRARVELAPA